MCWEGCNSRPLIKSQAITMTGELFIFNSHSGSFSDTSKDPNCQDMLDSIVEPSFTYLWKHISTTVLMLKRKEKHILVFLAALEGKKTIRVARGIHKFHFKNETTSRILYNSTTARASSCLSCGMANMRWRVGR